ncbi:MAG: LacI family DNA-binding transcriptional regulator [Aggregatilineales bacterium]
MSKQRITMENIAKTAQVSKMTVSRVLNNKPGVSEETRQRVFEVVSELGYAPQQQILGQMEGTTLIALLIPDHPTIYLGELLRGVFRAAEQLNCGLMLYTQSLFNHAISPNNILSPFRTGLVDGVVMVVPRNYETVVADLRRYEVPYVIIDHRSETENEASVTATNRKGMLEATRYLLALGHTRIGFITGRMDIACSHDRLQGYCDALTEVGMAVNDELILEGDFLQPSGFKLTQKLLQSDQPPTAVIASNDMMGLGAMEAARVNGFSIGEALSIIGFDDLFLSSQSYPPLTTVRQPLTEMGEVALEMLIALLQERTVLTLQRELPTELIIRETTGRVR